MHGNVPVRFGRGRLDSLGNKGLAAYLIDWPTVRRGLGVVDNFRMSRPLRGRPRTVKSQQASVQKRSTHACRSDSEQPLGGAEQVKRISRVRQRLARTILSYLPAPIAALNLSRWNRSFSK